MQTRNKSYAPMPLPPRKRTDAISINIDLRAVEASGRATWNALMIYQTWAMPIDAMTYYTLRGMGA